MHLDLSLGEGEPTPPATPLLADPAPATARGLVDAGLPVPGTPTPADSAHTALRAWVTVVTGAADPCLLLNASGLVTACAPAAVELLGLPEPAAMVGRGLLSGLLQPIDFTADGHRLADWELAKLPPLAALATGALSRGLLRLRRGRRVRTVDAVATPLHHDADVIGSLTFFHQV